MTCRHSPDDPACSNNPNGWRAAELEAENQRYKAEQRAKEKAQKDAEKKKVMDDIYARTPDVDNYEIVDSERIGEHLVLKVSYPNCKKCAYEGMKVLVFLNIQEKDAMKWRRIDPHFRDPKATRKPTEAPPPAARFPASKDGWTDAITYARGKGKS